MRAVLAILFGASLTIATAWSIGAIVLRKLSLTLYRIEERLFAFMVGSACLSAIMFALAALKLVHRGVLLALAILAIGYAIYSGAYRSKGPVFPPVPLRWKLVFGVAFSFFTVLYFFNALAPEISPDGMAYHLGEVAKYSRAHGFVRITTNMYGNLSQGMELLFSPCVHFRQTLRGGSGALRLSTVPDLPDAFLRTPFGTSRSWRCRRDIPVRQSGGWDRRNHRLQRRGCGGNRIRAVLSAANLGSGARREAAGPIGILTGFAFATKYTAFVAVPYALGFIAWKQWRARQAVFRPVLATAALALIFIAPWLLKNWIWVDNPFSPFANRLFPNPYVHIAFEEDYRKMEQTYGLTSRWQIPWQVTVKGEILAGFFGPLFLLTPLALLALRQRAGRQLWLAALVFGLPFYANVGSRFLIPAAPFVSLALALTFANVESLLLVLALAHAISCWPRVEKHYCYSSAWRLNNIPLKAALRIEPEDDVPE